MIYGSDAGFEPPTPSDKQERINNILAEIAKAEDELFEIRMEEETVVGTINDARRLTFNLKDAVRERYTSEKERLEDLIRMYHNRLSELGLNK